MNYYVTPKEDYASPSFVTVEKLFLALKRTKGETKFETELISQQEKELKGGFKYEHHNIWDAIYKVRTSHAKITWYWVKFTDPEDQKIKYMRFARYDLKGLQLYDDFTKRFEPLTYGWGHPEILTFKNNNLKTEYGLPDVLFKNEKDFLKDIDKPHGTNLNVLFDEIFADG